MEDDLIKTAGAFTTVADHHQQASFSAQKLGDVLLEISTFVKAFDDIPMEIVRHPRGTKGKPYVLSNTVILMHPDDIDELVGAADLVARADEGVVDSWRGLPIRDTISKQAASRLQQLNPIWRHTLPFGNF